LISKADEGPRLVEALPDEATKRLASLRDKNLEAVAARVLEDVDPDELGTSPARYATDTIEPLRVLAEEALHRSARLFYYLHTSHRRLFTLTYTDYEGKAWSVPRPDLDLNNPTAEPVHWSESARIPSQAGRCLGPA
jgi:hypothetical protein